MDYFILFAILLLIGTIHWALVMAVRSWALDSLSTAEEALKSMPLPFIVHIVAVHIATGITALIVWLLVSVL